jgi:hypothetical protein
MDERTAVRLIKSTGFHFMSRIKSNDREEETFDPIRPRLGSRRERRRTPRNRWRKSQPNQERHMRVEEERQLRQQMRERGPVLQR